LPAVEGRVIVVTGASAGIGRATVRELARRRAAVGLVARGRDGLEGAAREARALGARAAVAPADVADADAVEAAAATVERELGPIDVWVNAAMATVLARVVDSTAAEIRRTTEVTYLGYVHGTLAALRRMVPRDRGTIVQVGSALAYRGIPLQAAYCGAKHAIQGFTESLRAELRHDGSAVAITMVHLPGVNSTQFDLVRARLPRRPRPVAPVYQPEVAARAIAWAAEHPRRELWVGAPTVGVILADRLAPGLLERYLARTAVGGQQTDEPADPERPDYLFAPVPGDHGAHGRFDDEAREASLQLRAATHRGWLLAAAGACAGGAAALARRSARRGRRPA
jgi:short-subunit dehydrogenase